jgi:signal transduction histidine kinase
MPFFCDAELLEHALSNLLDNAIKYSGSPDVVLSAHADGARAILSVEDHGAGIPEEHRARIFERFYRVDKDRSRTCGGTGLGLAIVKHIARLHGGEATLSTPASGGCRFEISIASQPGQGKPPPRVNATS